MTIQNINVTKGGEKTTYKLGKEFFALLRMKNDHRSDEAGKEIPIWNKFNVLLTDDPKEHIQILKRFKDQEKDYLSNLWISGFAYGGKEITLTGGPQEKIALRKINKNHSFFKDTPDTKFYGNYRKALVNGHDVIIENIRSSDFLAGFVKAKERYNLLFTSTFDRNIRIITDDGNNLLVGNWINGTKTFFYDNSTPPQEGCFNLMLLEKEKISKVEFECKGR